MEFVASAAGGLDNYSAFLTPGQLRDVYSQIEGNFVGLGVELKADDGALLIVRVISGSPAEKAGIVAGERIIAVDGQPTSSLSTDEAAGLLTGAEGSLVRVTLDSSGAQGAEPSLRVGLGLVREGAQLFDDEREPALRGHAALLRQRAGELQGTDGGGAQLVLLLDCACLEASFQETGPEPVGQVRLGGSRQFLAEVRRFVESRVLDAEREGQRPRGDVVEKRIRVLLRTLHHGLHEAALLLIERYDVGLAGSIRPAIAGDALVQVVQADTVALQGLSKRLSAGTAIRQVDHVRPLLSILNGLLAIRVKVALVRE